MVASSGRGTETAPVCRVLVPLLKLVCVCGGARVTEKARKKKRSEVVEKNSVKEEESSRELIFFFLLSLSPFSLSQCVSSRPIA